MRRLVISLLVLLAGLFSVQDRVLVPLSDIRTTAAIYDLTPEIAGEPATYTATADSRLFVVVVNCEDPDGGQRALGILPYRYVTSDTLDKVEAGAFKHLVPECGILDN
jgi:hypothetical protein